MHRPPARFQRLKWLVRTRRPGEGYGPIVRGDAGISSVAAHVAVMPRAPRFVFPETGLDRALSLFPRRAGGGEKFIFFFLQSRVWKPRDPTPNRLGSGNAGCFLIE